MTDNGTRTDWKQIATNSLLYGLAVLASDALTHVAMSPGTARDVCFVVFIPIIGFGLHEATEAVLKRRSEPSSPSGGNPSGRV
ncbi:hypothetical protein OG352_26390 [Streptomyces sp. NBC_01485]|uniref:hypothetical protein n=1 Tax=Streptomyces sp. NBC_01485 TaxID=2903884 RepID=UPI002E37CA88|nr:hypothetical protein [Streptomyces sp. NBC_01485]